MASLFKRRKPQRVLFIGLDCASPSLVFDEFRADLPVLNGLAAQGVSGVLDSCVPCITVPAWASMMSSRDPGVLGFYGFRNRADHTYANMTVANSTSVQEPRTWDYTSAAGKNTVVMGVPQTYPVRPVNGHLVSCFLTPGTESAFTYPAIFKQEILNQAPRYPFDVKGFRTEDKDWLYGQIVDLVETQFRVVKHTMQHKPWDFLMHVNMGIDRVHHGFWRYHDPQHRLHEPGSRYRHVIRELYKMVDQLVGELLALVDDDVTVIVASDHGIKRMDGGICINEWLWRTGWMALKTDPVPGSPMRFEDAEIDWSRTRAWASGGYYGRIFLNVAGREPHGVIPRESYATVRDALAEAIKDIPDTAGNALNTQVYKPEDIYAQVNGIAPDLIVYFGDLHWRSVGSFGHDGLHTLDNDTGPDDANHAQEGLYIICQPGKRGARVENHQLMDIAPTVLTQLGLSIPGEMQGNVINV